MKANVVEYYCGNCKKASQICSPDSCGVDKATITCRCGTVVKYPTATPQPHFCEACERIEIRKHSARHRKLDSFGEVRPPVT
jgi:exosome complex RNA-binding protein Csl4